MNNPTEIMDSRRKTATVVVKGIFLLLILFLPAMPFPALAKEAHYTVQLVPSAAQVQPGDTVQITERPGRVHRMKIRIPGESRKTGAARHE